MAIVKYQKTTKRMNVKVARVLDIVIPLILHITCNKKGFEKMLTRPRLFYAKRIYRDSETAMRKYLKNSTACFKFDFGPVNIIQQYYVGL